MTGQSKPARDQGQKVETCHAKENFNKSRSQSVFHCLKRGQWKKERAEDDWLYFYSLSLQQEYEFECKAAIRISLTRNAFYSFKGHQFLVSLNNIMFTYGYISKYF